MYTSHTESVLTLEDLSNELEAVADWHTLGVKLGVEDHKLREIEEQYHDPQRRKHEVLSRSQIIIKASKNSFG